MPRQVSLRLVLLLQQLLDLRERLTKGFHGRVEGSGLCEVDARTGFRTRSILALPVRDRSGRVFGVAQLLNARGGTFGDEEEKRFDRLVTPLVVVLETWTRLTRLSGDAR